MLDQIRRNIQALLDELLGEVDKLRRALAALGSHESEPDADDHAAPVTRTAAGRSAQSSTTTPRAPRTRTASVPPQPAPTSAPTSSAAAPARARTAQGATKTAVLAALAEGSAMTAGEIAAATGLGRATVSTTLSKLASSGEIAKAARGYQLGRESDRTRKPARRRSSTSTDATSPSPEPVEPEAVEPEAVEPDAVEAQAVEPDAAEPDAAEPLAVEPDAAEPEALEPLAVEPEPVEPEAAEPLAVEPEAAEPEAVEPESAEPPSAGGAVGSAARPAPGATKHAVLAALAGGSAMTAGEVASATGLARASVSTTLSRLATAGEVTKAARGYQLAGVEPAQRFYFLIEDDVTPRAVVANLPELEAVIAVCGPAVLRDHCVEHDFSRWVADVIHNEPLAAEIAEAEAQLSVDSSTETVEAVRLALIAALQARHAT